MTSNNHVARDRVGKPALSRLISLFELTVNASRTYRFVADDVAQASVVFSGETYNAYPIAATGFVWTADGPPARPVVEISNILGLFNDAVDADDLRGRSVRRILTLDEELAPPHGNDGGACFPVEEWVIDRIARLDARILRLELNAAASLENRVFPERVMLRDLCQHRYRRWDARRRRFDYDRVTCPYTGSQYFTAEGTPTTNAAADRCSLALTTGCARRFSGPKPFLGFPGITRL